jgi:hypothetical protein
MQTKAHHQEQESLWITKQQAEALTGLDESTLKNHRLTTGRLIRDIHWQAIGTRKTLYNRILLNDWITNFNDPANHQRFIDSYLKGLEAQRKQMEKGNFAFA